MDGWIRCCAFNIQCIVLNTSMFICVYELSTSIYNLNVMQELYDAYKISELCVNAIDVTVRILINDFTKFATHILNIVACEVKEFIQLETTCVCVCSLNLQKNVSSLFLTQQIQHFCVWIVCKVGFQKIPNVSIVLIIHFISTLTTIVNEIAIA